MRVIGAGFGRTGTLSMKTALEQLGFGPCHHMMEVIRTPGQMRKWLAVAEGRAVDWDDIMSGYESSVDWPAAAYWHELADHFPEAKVVLTVRDPERWLASMKATILRQTGRSSTLPGKLMRGFSAALGTDFAAMAKMTRLAIMERVFDGRMTDDDHLLSVFDAHVKEVKATIPAERLLVFEVSEGWGPLCEFLEVPVPDGPFPRVNDSEAFGRTARETLGTLMFRRSR
jgi:hypothetical protein